MIDQADISGVPAQVKRKKKSLAASDKLLPAADGRSSWARRSRSLFAEYASDLGGVAEISSAEKSILHRVIALQVALERQEATFAENDRASPDEIDLHARTSANLRRLLESLGLKRRQIDVTSTLDAYLDRGGTNAQ